MCCRSESFMLWKIHPWLDPTLLYNTFCHLIKFSFITRCKIDSICIFKFCIIISCYEILLYLKVICSGGGDDGASFIRENLAVLLCYKICLQNNYHEFFHAQISMYHYECPKRYMSMYIYSFLCIKILRGDYFIRGVNISPWNIHPGVKISWGEYLILSYGVSFLMTSGSYPF